MSDSTTVEAVIVMGVSGSGKTTIGEMLAERWGWPFYDADDFHPQANIDKMSAGIPLQDEDRWPWLDALHELMVSHLAEGRPLVLAGSSLKEVYRTRMVGDIEPNRVLFVYLNGSFEVIWQRMSERPGHFMKADMLRSQFTTLEEPSPAEALWVDITQEPEEIVDVIVSKMGRL